MMTVDWDPNAQSVTVLQGKAAETKEKCFDNLVSNMDSAHHDYEVEGPNSNTVV
jgi:hypothetical protein